MVWIWASSWSRRSRTSLVGFMPRSPRPRQHRSASTEPADRPLGVGNDGKCTCPSPMSNRHRSAMSSERSQSSGRSTNSRRMAAAGLR